jgi:hypothetical protein
MATVTLEPADVIDSISTGEEKRLSFSGEAVETLLDGSFSMQNVAPGRYYAVASKVGYVSPVSLLYVRGNERSKSEDGVPKKAPKAAPLITVQANLPVVVNVTIERGAAVSGTVLYDDGSPASGLRLALLVRSKDQWVSVPSNPVENASFGGYTDDLGKYRISGLPAGEYLLEVTLHLSKTMYKADEQGGTSMRMNHVYSLSIYSGGSTRRKDGVPFSITSGEERSGENVDIPLTKLHAVRGSLVAAHDGHLLNGGRLSLLYADDRSVAANTFLTKDDPAFRFSFVPEGDYILHVDEAADNEYREVPNSSGGWPPTTTEARTLQRYGSADKPIHVAGDFTEVIVEVPDLVQRPQSTM